MGTKSWRPCGLPWMPRARRNDRRGSCAPGQVLGGNEGLPRDRGGKGLPVEYEQGAPRSQGHEGEGHVLEGYAQEACGCSAPLPEKEHAGEKGRRSRGAERRREEDIDPESACRQVGGAA